MKILLQSKGGDYMKGEYKHSNSLDGENLDQQQSDVSIIRVSDSQLGLQ